MSNDAGAEVMVSVLITAYEHEAYIGRALDSVLAQRGVGELEILVGDDCSADGTREILRRYAATHPEQIGLYLPETNMGLAGKVLFSELISRSRGRYIATLDGDDFWTCPDKLRRQVAYMEAHPGCALSFHDVMCRYENAAREDALFHGPDATVGLTLAAVLQSCEVPACSIVCRRGVIDPLPAWYFDVLWGDWPLVIMAAQHGDLAYLPEPMGVYRIHEAGFYSGMDKRRQLEHTLRFYERLEGELAPSDDRFRRQALALNWLRMSTLAADRGERAAAARCLVRGVRIGQGDVRRLDAHRHEVLAILLRLLVPARLRSIAKRAARARPLRSRP